MTYSITHIKLSYILGFFFKCFELKIKSILSRSIGKSCRKSYWIHWYDDKLLIGECPIAKRIICRWFIFYSLFIFYKNPQTISYLGSISFPLRSPKTIPPCLHWGEYLFFFTECVLSWGLEHFLFILMTYVWGWEELKQGVNIRCFIWLKTLEIKV